MLLSPAVRFIPIEQDVQFEGKLMQVKQLGLHKKQRLLASSWKFSAHWEHTGKPLAPRVHMLHPKGQGAQ